MADLVFRTHLNTQEAFPFFSCNISNLKFSININYTMKKQFQFLNHSMEFVMRFFLKFLVYRHLLVVEERLGVWYMGTDEHNWLWPRLVLLVAINFHYFILW